MKMSDNDESFYIVSKVQSCGILFKKSFANHSNKWSKRFFLVKDGFLLYYSEGEKKTFDKKKYFNIHPKGVIPLGGCHIQTYTDMFHEYIIQIHNDNFINGCVSLAAETRYDQDRWIQTLKEAARITLENSKIGESIIRDLENRGLELNREKQCYVDKLHEETIALQDEIDKNGELERLNLALDEEKKRLEKMINEFKEEHNNMKKEYEETIIAMRVVQQDKETLEESTHKLQQCLQELEDEKLKILDNLQYSDKEPKSLINTNENLQINLKEIEEETKCLLEEKKEVEERYQENELRAKILQEEKEIISHHSDQLLSSLSDLIGQRGLAEEDLRVEVAARLEAENQLRQAQDSVQQLEGVLEKNKDSEQLRDKLLPDVKRLRQFFERVAEEARMDADMPVIMKNAVYARKSLAIRGRAQKLEQSRQDKARSLGLDLGSPLDGPLKRSLSIMISKHSLTPNLPHMIASRVNNGSLRRSQSGGALLSPVDVSKSSSSP